ncbi:unnamed protein product [Malus baccata var. baccata]
MVWMWKLLEIKENGVSSIPTFPPYFVPQLPPPPPNLQSNSLSFGNKVSPSMLLIVIIVAIVFFVAVLLHLLVRFLLRPPARDSEDLESVTVLQGQLQQLFRLHDAGVDQSFIDALPVFYYKAIIGLKNPFDCAVCLCEFEAEDNLRLLPKCSHAFHMKCIDTWLLSHSTCPLCRATLLPDFSRSNGCSPIVFVLESGSDSSREMVSDRDGLTSHLGFHGDMELGLSYKSCEIMAKNEANTAVMVDSGKKVVPVKLGKFRNVDSGGEGSSDSNVDSRRCFSMGSFAYVMDDKSELRVPIRASMKRQAMSECDCESRREFKFSGVEAIGSLETQGTSTGASCTNGNGSNGIGRSMRESFSISKIWLMGKKEKPNGAADSSRRAFSFRFPVHQSAVAAGEGAKAKNVGSESRRTISEIEIGSSDSQANPPSFARRTLMDKLLSLITAFWKLSKLFWEPESAFCIVLLEENTSLGLQNHD